MHETRFTNEIFAVLKEKLTAEMVLDIVTVKVRLSPFSHVSPETLQESFKALSKGENYKDLRLEILSLELDLKCGNCHRSKRITKRILNCPFCSSADIDIQMDKEFFVESIEIEPRKISKQKHAQGQ